MFHRWTLRGAYLGETKIDKGWYRGEHDADDLGAYEIIEGSFARRRFDLFFTGRKLQGEWLLEKVSTKWSFRPAS